jgi:cellulose synthase/poly-beta-1,6-N-acetylglucosamine synthase-like glycosyltransferase
MALGWLILDILDIVLFVVVAFTTIYITIFSIAARCSKRSNTPTAQRQNRFIILIPAHKQDDTVEETVKSIVGQTYPQHYFDVTVISNNQKEMTNFRLAQYPITLLPTNFDNNIKAQSLQIAINNLPQFKIYDIVIVLDASSLVEPKFLEQMNNAFEAAGTKAIQAHRMPKNRDTAIANLDAIFDEINNSIFRRGHINIGLSAATSGSGTAYEYKWFANNIKNLKTAIDDKDIESLLLRQKIFIDYFDDIHVYDEKKRATQDFNEQRGHWVSSQFHSILSNIKYLPGAFINKRYDLADKIIQWMLVPRTIMVGIIVVMSLILPFIYLSLAIKWWILFAFVMFILALAVPDYLVDKNWDKSFMKAPFIIIGSLFNITKIFSRKR